jgi:hypothetical protein
MPKVKLKTGRIVKVSWDKANNLVRSGKAKILSYSDKMMSLSKYKSK